MCYHATEMRICVHTCVAKRRTMEYVSNARWNPSNRWILCKWTIKLCGHHWWTHWCLDINTGMHGYQNERVDVQIFVLIVACRRPHTELPPWYPILNSNYCSSAEARASEEFIHRYPILRRASQWQHNRAPDYQSRQRPGAICSFPGSHHWTHTVEDL